MSDIDTYSGIVDFVTAHLQLDAETAAQLPNLIRMGELKLKRRILTPEREAVATTPTEAGDQTVRLPDDFRQARTVMLDDDYPLEQVTLNALQSQFAKDGLTGKPRAYAIANGALYFGPIPDAVYSVGLTYQAELTPLTEENFGNWLTNSNPDAYVYATLAEAEAFRGNLEAARAWLGQLEDVLSEINDEGNRYRNSAPVRLRSSVVV